MLSRRICQEAASSSGWLRCCRAKLFPSQASTSTHGLFKKEFHSKDEVHEFSSTTQVSKDKRDGTNKGTSGFFDFSLKPPVKPVKPAMRFMKYYVGSKREHISGGKEVLQEEAVEAAHAWNALTDKEKKKYIDAYDAENSEYKKKLEAWKQDTGVEHPNALRDKKRRLALSYEKPQPPVPAFSAFRRDFAVMHPEEKGREAAQIAWRNLSDGKRQEYIDKWKTELDVYRAEMFAWREKMAREGHEDVIQAFKDGRFRRVPAEKTKHQILLDLGKPVHPLSAFHAFAKECAKNPAEQEKTVELWAALNDDEKQKYRNKYEAEMIEYNKNLLNWQAEMVAKGRSDVVDANKFKKMQLTSLLAYFHRDFVAKHPNINGERAMRNAWETLSSEKKQEYEDRWKGDNAANWAEVLAWHEKVVAESRKSAAVKNVQNRTRKAKYEIHRNLGKPKLPSPPSISFMNKLGKGPADKKEAGKAWTELPDSEKQKYRDQYRLDLAEYRKKVLDWKAHMVAERPADVVNQEEYQKLVLKESDQPKKPPSPNVMFSLDYWAKHGKAPGSVAEIVKAPVEQWKLLPEKEKQKYSDRFKTEMLEYKMKLLDWKAGMIAKGRTDLVDPEEYKQLVLEMSGQPKPPPAAHLMFYRDYAAEHKRVAGRAADLMKVASVQWKNLPEEDKQKYYNRYSDEWYAYEKRLRDWEREMTTISLEDDEDE